MKYDFPSCILAKNHSICLDVLRKNMECLHDTSHWHVSVRLHYVTSYNILILTKIRQLLGWLCLGRHLKPEFL